MDVRWRRGAGVVLALAAALAGCIRSDLVECGPLLCARDQVCAPGGGCVFPDQLTACVDQVDGVACNSRGVGDGVCTGGVCSQVACGDGLIGADEQCDDGAANSDGADAHCRTDCTLGRCGDGIVDPGMREQCDDKNFVDGDGCSHDCESNEQCGNGIVDVPEGEACDDGNTRSLDGCSLCAVDDVIVLAPGQTPPARADHAMAYDGARERVVLFGGADTSALSDTWEWDGSSWTRMVPRHTPPGRTFHAMAYDAHRHRIVMFGGLGAAQIARSDTWEWDGVDWTRMQPAVSPPPMYYTAMAYDGVRKTIILHGGYDGATRLDGTWEWNGATWTKLAPASSPGGYSHHSMAYDAVAGKIVLYGGYSAGAVADRHTFTWDGVTWTDRGASTLPNLSGMAMAFNANDGMVTLVINRSTGPMEVWAWNDSMSKWTQLAGTLLQQHRRTAMAYDAARGTTVLFGGYSGSTFSDTNLWKNDAWSAPPTWVAPSARLGAGAAYDPVLGRAIVLSGRTDSDSTPLGDTWEWDGRRWMQKAVGITPAVVAASLVYDPSLHGVVAHGGHLSSPAPTDRLYAWTGTIWNELAGSSGHALFSTAVAYDTARDQLLVFGGTPWQGGSTNDFATWDSSGWHAIAATAPPARRASAMVYDPRRDRTVLFSGTSGSGVPNDTWEWNGTAWTEIVVPTSEPRRGASLQFDGDLGRPILFGNIVADLEELWEWTGTTWQARPIVNPPVPRYRSSIAYVARDHELLVFGGRDQASVATNATLLLRYRAPAAVEACTRDDLDYDGDGAAGCADSDCWALCTPLCPPGAPCAASAPRCGDSACDPLETCALCPQDCGTCSSGPCGDFRCSGTETATSCPNDCSP